MTSRLSTSFSFDPIIRPFPTNTHLPHSAMPNCTNNSTPITVLPLDLGLTWECANLSAFSFTGPATDQDEKSPFRYANVVAHQVVTIPPQSPWTHQMWHGSCITGQLTPLGAWQHRALGTALRDLYVDQLQFLPPTFDPESVYIRSTGI